jgi:16S rRNA U516 pseudouridylate synthase RsuA-like enzyme
MGKRKLSAKEKAEKKRRQREFQTVFMNGKMKRVRRPPTIEGMPPEEFIRANADPIWLHQNGLWEYLEEESAADEPPKNDEVPF